MFAELKSRLAANPDNVVALLEQYGYEHINIKGNQIRCARNNEGGQNISVMLNDDLYANDFVTGNHGDVFSFICNERNTELREVLQTTRGILGLGEDWRPIQKVSLFGGIYDHIGRRRIMDYSVLPESTLDAYERIPNVRFLHDHISLKVQKLFDIRYDWDSNTIVIPWRNIRGELIAVKNRLNYTPDEGMSKYFYMNPGPISSTLYGAFENYQYLYENDIFVFEAEKSTMQAASYGYRNAVSLGSNSLSQEQAKLLLQLHPKRLVWMLDEGLPKENTMHNVEVIKSFCHFTELPQAWWNWSDSLCVEPSSKNSPSDDGKNVFETIIQEECEEL